MHLENSKKAMIGVFSGIVFIIGIGIGVKLYAITSESSSGLNRDRTISNFSLNSQVEKKSIEK